jgi:hypothetical protein
MALEMASGIPLVFRGAATELGLKIEPQIDYQMTVGNIPISEKSVVDSLLIGTANFAKWSLYVLPGAGEGVTMFNGRPVLGSLTSQFMNVVDMELDLAGKKVNLFKQSSGCKGKQVYWGGEVTAVDLYHDIAGLLAFPMEIDGKLVEAAIDTQSATSTISETVTTKFFGFGRGSPGITTEANAAGNETASYRAMGMTAKGLAIKNVKIRLRDDLNSRCAPTSTGRSTRAIGFSKCSNVVPLRIGTDLLKRLRIYIASGEERIYFTRAASAVPGASVQPGTGQADPAGGAAAVPADAAGAATAVPGAAAGQAPPAR